MNIVSMTLLKAYAAFLHFIRPNSGLTTLCFNPLVNYLLKNVEGPLRAHMSPGVSIDIDPDEYHGRILWLAGSNDWKVSRVVNALLQKNDIFLDIGANYGSIGFAALSRISPGGHVHLFEPQCKLANRLSEAIQSANIVDKVTLHQIALSDSDGEITLSGPEHHSGMATIIPAETLDDRKRLHSEIVQMRVTESYIRPLLKKRNFAVKIDIEGAEPKVLPGLIAMENVRFIVFEGANFKRWLWDFFTGNDFKVFGLVRSPLSAKVQHVSRFEEWNAYHDFLAIRSFPDIPTGPLRLREFSRKLRISP